MPRILTLGWSTSNHLRAWVNGLAKRGNEITVITYDGAPIEGIEVISLPKSSFGRLAYLRYLPRVKKLAREIKPDLVHAHFITSYGFWGARVAPSFSSAKNRHIPLVLTAWGSDVTQSLNSALYSRVASYSLHRAVAITAPSLFLKNSIGELDSVAHARTTVIPFGLDFDKIDAALAKRNRTDNLVRVLFFKPIKSLYGPEVLIEAFTKAAESNPKLRLTIAGRGNMTHALRALASRLRVQDRIEFPGFVPFDEAYEFIANHDIMAMPTLLPEGFGMAALEASALGLPVITTDIGAPPEIVQHEATGILVPPGDKEALADALSRLAADDSLRRKLGEHGRTVARIHFQWNHSVDRMCELYGRFLSS